MAPHNEKRPGSNMPNYVYNGDVCISGMSGRMPRSNNLEEFKENLFDHVDMVSSVEECREMGFYLPLRCGKIKALSEFDAEFFLVSPRNAHSMDPQMRKLLECTYEAITDAGESFESLKGSRTGVYIGVRESEASEAWSRHPDYKGPSNIGCSLTMFSNRLSYFFDLKGPSFSVDTACSSSLVALNKAMMDLRMGITDAAIFGATNLFLRPSYGTGINSSGVNMLAADGKCKTFDESADGYVRAESVVVMYLRRAEDCKRVYATVMHCAVNTDGFKKEGVTYPSGQRQKELYREIYSDLALSPLEVSYIETHGTGTKVGDPIEVNAVADFFCEGRKGPLLIGSTKSNMGHAEPVSGMCSIAKVIISMEESELPANLHFKNPNPSIPSLTDGRFQVVTENTPWNGQYAGISNFGFGGSNSHVILRKNLKEFKAPHPASQKPRLFKYCGRTEAGVKQVLEFAKKNAHNVELQALMEGSSNISTQKFPFRGYTVLNVPESFEDVQRNAPDARPIWFVFAGMGSQWHGMGRKLMALDVFCNSIKRTTKYLGRYNLDMYDLIMNGDETTFNQTIPSFVGITTIQIALVDLLFAMGIRPDGIVGHSLGELGCAYADGSLTAEEAVLAAYWRGRCVAEATIPKGKMAAVGLSWEECKKLCPKGVVPACHNSTDTVTISGPFDTTTKFIEELSAKGIFTREVNSANVAYHSYFMNDIAPQLKVALDKVIVPKKRSSKWISTSLPESRWNEQLAKYSSSDYHVNNLVSPVLFQEGLQKVPRDALVIEIAPHHLLQSILKRSIGRKAVIVGCMKRMHENNVHFFLDSIGKAYANGLNVNALGLYPAVEYPVPRGTPTVSSVIYKAWDHSESWAVPTQTDFPDCELGKTSFEFEIDCSENGSEAYLTDHRIDGRIIFPGTGYLFLAWQALARSKGKNYQDIPVVFKNVRITKATVFQSREKINMKVTIMENSGQFEISVGGEVSSVGIVYSPEGEFMDRDLYPAVKACETEAMKAKLSLTKGEIYKTLKIVGYQYGPAFQGVERSHIMGTKSEIKWTGNWVVFLDNILHTFALTTFGRSLHVPTIFTFIKIDPRKHPSAPAEGEEPKFLPAFNDKTLKMAACCGVEVHQIGNGIAPRRPQGVPTTEEYRFVPYTAESPELFDSSLKDYFTKCLNYAMSSLQILLSKDVDNVLPNKDLLVKIVKDNGPSHKADLSQFRNVPNTGFAQALETVFSLPLSKDFEVNAGNALSSIQTQLSSDLLLSSLDQIRILKPALDLVLESCLTTKLTMYEIGAKKGCMHSHILDYMSSHPGLKIQYTAADKSPTSVTSKIFDVKVQDWDLSTATTPPKAQSNLVILKNVLHKQKDLDKAFQMVSSMVTPDGFILVEEVTDNYSLHLVIEGLSQKLEIPSTNHGRVFGFLSEKMWISFFAQHGFDVIYKKSDQLLSSIFLLRRKVNVNVLDLIYVDDLEGSWLEQLKSKMRDLEAAPKESRLWLAARNQMNGVVGLVNCLRSEAGGEKVRFMLVSNLNDLSPQPDLNMSSSEIKSIVEKDMLMNVYRDGKWGCFKHVLIPRDTSLRVKPRTNAFANIGNKGDLSSFRWIESNMKYFDNSSDALDLCTVYYTALNFRDVMVATGKLPTDALQINLASKECVIGIEFSGRTSKGKRVAGLLPHMALGTQVAIHDRFLIDLPDSWSMEEGATVVVAYATVIYAMIIRGQIKKGDRVLIHSGSGGVGQAAIAVALSYGCEVFVTTGSNEKKEFLKKTFPQLKDENFSSSRDGFFEHHIRKQTNGEGVDIVLNSLADEKLQSSLRVLAQHGTFLEIGKLDLSNNTALGMQAFLKNITVHGVLMDALFEGKGLVHLDKTFNILKDLIQKGDVKPLNYTVFNKEELEPAFRYMAQGKHIGKVLIKIKAEEKEKICTPVPACIPAVARAYFNPAKSYIVTGGLGGFGLELAIFLSLRGAEKLILTSRSGVTSTYQARCIDLMSAQGAQAQISKHNCKTLAGTKALLKEAGKLGPVGGIFNLAMVLQDGLFENQTLEMFEQVADPKIKGTINLDKATRELCNDTLDWFVTFSSVACGRGNLGQTNYGFSNSVMERICEKRRADNLHGLAIQWGAIGDVGVVAENMVDEYTPVGGCLPQKMDSCLNVFDMFLNLPYPVVSSFLQADTAVKKETWKPQTIVEAVNKALGLKENSLSGNMTLDEIGLDSFMGVEIKQMLEREFDVFLSTKQVVQLTMNKLREMDAAEGRIAVGEETTEKA